MPVSSIDRTALITEAAIALETEFETRSANAFAGLVRDGKCVVMVSRPFGYEDDTFITVTVEPGANQVLISAELHPAEPALNFGNSHYAPGRLLEYLRHLHIKGLKANHEVWFTRGTKNGLIMHSHDPKKFVSMFAAFGSFFNRVNTAAEFLRDDFEMDFLGTLP